MIRRHTGWLVLALFAGLFLGPAQADPAGCQARAGVWQSADSRCVARISTSSSSESVQVPTGLPAPIQQAADATLAELRGKFEEKAAKAAPDRPFSLGETYEQIPGPDGVVNLVMTVFAEIGEYHPVTEYRTLTFKGERRIQLADLFRDGTAALGSVYPIVKADLERQLVAGETGETAELAEHNIAQGTGTDPAHYQYFVLGKDELRFLFLPYQVACYACGPHAGHVPLALVQELLTPGLA